MQQQCNFSNAAICDWAAKMDQVGTQNFTTFFKFIALQLKLCSGNCNKISTIDEQFYKPYIFCDLHAESK